MTKPRIVRDSVIEASEKLDESLAKPEIAIMTLWQMTEQLLAIDDALESAGGEITLELEAAIDALEGAWDDKAERICHLIENHEATVNAMEPFVRKYTQRRDSSAKARRSLLAYLLREMGKRGIRFMEVGPYKLRIQKNGRPSIRWTGEPKDIPEPFKRVVTELDGTAAYDAYRVGKLPEGFLIDQGEHLRVS